jgi:hypothetical protein
MNFIVNTSYNAQRGLGRLSSEQKLFCKTDAAINSEKHNSFKKSAIKQMLSKNTGKKYRQHKY